MAKETITITPETPFKLSITTLVSVAVSLLIGGAVWGTTQADLRSSVDMDTRLEKRADQNQTNILTLIRTIERIDERTLSTNQAVKEIQERINGQPKKYGSYSDREVIAPIQRNASTGGG